MKRVYIAGPMGGHVDLNFPAFAAEAARLRALGHEVLNPAEINPDHGTPWAQCMRRDIAALVTCEVVQTLPGWQRSPGASFEVYVATTLELEVWHS